MCCALMQTESVSSPWIWKSRVYKAKPSQPLTMLQDQICESGRSGFERCESEIALGIPLRKTAQRSDAVWWYAEEGGPRTQRQVRNDVSNRNSSSRQYRGNQCRMPPIHRRAANRQKAFGASPAAFQESTLRVVESSQVCLDEEFTQTSGTFGFLRPAQIDEETRCIVRQVLEEQFVRRYTRNLQHIRSSFIQDMKLQSSLHHPNLASPFAVLPIPLSSIYEYMDFRWERVTGLEFATHTPLPCITLCDFLSRARDFDIYHHIEHGLLNDIHAQIAMDVANGLAFLHSQKLAHNSLVPESILISNAPSLAGKVLCKLMDHGEAFLHVNALVHNERVDTDHNKCTADDVRSYGLVLQHIMFLDDETSICYEHQDGADVSFKMSAAPEKGLKNQDMSASFEMLASARLPDGQQITDKPTSPKRRASSSEEDDVDEVITENDVEVMIKFNPLQALVNIKDLCLNSETSPTTMTNVLSQFVKDFQTRTQVACEGNLMDLNDKRLSAWRQIVKTEDYETQTEIVSVLDNGSQVEPEQKVDSAVQYDIPCTAEADVQAEPEVKDMISQTANTMKQAITQTKKIRTKDQMTGFHPETVDSEVQNTASVCDDETQMLFKYAILPYCINLPPEDRSMSKHKLPINETCVNYETKSRVCTIWKQNVSHFVDPEYLPRTILMLGATGSGKSTLVDGLVNHIYGVDWEDDFRFSIIDIKDDEKQVAGNQAQSQTQWITTYAVQPTEGSRIRSELKIVDMPGFADTAGIGKDENLIERLEKIFALPEEEGGIQQLDLVCFVVQASLSRLTPSQKYILSSLESIFDKSIKENIFVLITFADGKSPPVLQALAGNQTSFQKHFVFNNSGLFALNSMIPSNDKFAKMFWDMGITGFADVLSVMQGMETKSLQLSKEVLGNRRMIAITITALRQRIHKGLNTLDRLMQEKRMLKQRISEVEANKDFEYDVKEAKYVSVALAENTFTTNCKVCCMSCHYPCGIKDNASKQHCAAMSKEGENSVCTVCPNKCSWRDHINDDHRFDLQEVISRKTYFEMKTKYDRALEEGSSIGDIISDVSREFDMTQKQVEKLIDEIAAYTNSLNELALANHSPMTKAEYLKMMISSEHQDKKPGFQNRVQLLTDALQETELQEDLVSGEFNPWGKYMEDPELFEEKKPIGPLKRFAIKSWNMLTNQK